MFQNVDCVSGSEGWTLAHMAAFCGRLDCLHLLFKHHATVDAVDHDGNTPRAYAKNIVINVYFKSHLLYLNVPLFDRRISN